MKLETLLFEPIEDDYCASEDLVQLHLYSVDFCIK